MVVEQGTGNEPRAVITDLGLARRLVPGRTSEAPYRNKSGRSGTPEYMAPEQVSGGELSEATDIYALGVIAYEMLTGVLPFTGGTRKEVAEKRLYEGPRLPRSIAPDLDTTWETVILKCLEREPAKRFANVTELQEAFGQHSAGAIGAPPKRTKWTTLLPSGLGVLLLVLLGVLMIHEGLDRPRSAAALKWYEYGVSHLREGSYFEASKALQQALTLDDQDVRTHALLAEAWSELDYSDRAQKEMLRARPVSNSSTTRLSEVDQLRIDAIYLSVTRQYAGAVTKYREIAARSPEPERARALVDLGRTQEKAQDVKGALASYLEASRQDPQYPVALLRLGILYARKQNVSAAEDAFARARGLYEATSNMEGIAEVAYQLGYMVSSTVGNVTQAAEYLRQSLDRARLTGNVYQQIRALLQLSKVSYTAARVDRAKSYADEALKLAQKNSAETLTLRGLVELGNVAEVQGDTAAAERYFSQALEIAEAHKLPRSTATALFSLGSLNIQHGRVTEGLRYLEQSRDWFDKAGFRKESAQVLILIGRAKRDSGDYEGSYTIFKDQLAAAAAVKDRAQSALAHQSLGSVLSQQGRYREALPEYRESYRVTVELGDEIGRAYGLLNIGTTLWQLGVLKEAEQALRKAQIVSESGGFNEALLAVKQSYVDMFLSRRQFERAQVLAEGVLASTQHDIARTVSAHAALCLASKYLGDITASRTHCAEAAKIAMATNNPSLKCDALLTSAEAQIGSSGLVAIATAQQALVCSSQLGRAESEWRAALLLVRGYALSGDRENSKKYRERAAELNTTMQKIIGEEYTPTYFARPDFAHLIWRSSKRSKND